MEEGLGAVGGPVGTGGEGGFGGPRRGRFSRTGGPERRGLFTWEKKALWTFHLGEKCTIVHFRETLAKKQAPEGRPPGAESGFSTWEKKALWTFPLLPGAGKAPVFSWVEVFGEATGGSGQVLPEHRGRAHGPCEPVSAAEREEWRTMAQTWLEGLQAPAKAGAGALARKASYQWLAALDLALQHACGWGLARFQLRAPQKESVQGGGEGGQAGQLPGRRGKGRARAAQARSATETPAERELRRAHLAEAGAQLARERRLGVLSIACDQGAVGWPALFVLEFELAVVVVVQADAPHRVWNDTQAAIDSVPTLRDARHLSTLLFGLNTGPFDSAAWWQQIREAAGELSQLATPSDPLFARYLPDILNERGEPELRWDTEHHARVLEGLPAVMEYKGGKVPRSRWFHFVDVAQQAPSFFRAVSAQGPTMAYGPGGC